MARYLTFNENHPYVLLTGGELQAEELFGDFDEAIVADPLKDPYGDGFIPIEMVPDPDSLPDTPESQRYYTPKFITLKPFMRSHVADKIKASTRVSATVLRYRPSAVAA